MVPDVIDSNCKLGKKTSGDVTELVVYSDAQIVALTAKALHGGDVI